MSKEVELYQIVFPVISPENTTTTVARFKKLAFGSNVDSSSLDWNNVLMQFPYTLRKIKAPKEFSEEDKYTGLKKFIEV
jgi:hypothetical protein